MAGVQASAVLRAGRWLLPLTIPACCVVWMLLVFSPPTPELDAGHRQSFHVIVGETVAAIERRGTPPVLERVQESPPPAELLARTKTPSSSPPPSPESEETIDTSPPSPERRPRAQPKQPLPPERERILDASSQPELAPVRQSRTGIPASPPPPQPSHQHLSRAQTKPAAVSDRCAGRYIYVQDLPSRFNADLLRDCRSLSEWTDMCRHVANAGMGPRLTRTGGVLPPTGWYDTNQFTLEVIFHNRMRQYGCLTADASRASAVYVPYYAGLDVGRHLWGFSNDVRDALAEDLVGWLRSSPAWAAHGGRDHFLVGGRIAWDLRREDGGEWGSRLLFLPEARNMTALVLESGPWHVGDVGVPYPTYFHPSRAAEVASWQRTLRRARRPWLFAFVGARRPGDTLRDSVMDQCARSRRCGLLQCGRGRRRDCYAPGNVMRHLKSAAFCLQPPGDSYTRRSAFDAMLAGCVPVFFHPGSAYTQYRWHLPADHTRYSVFVPGDSVRNGTVRVVDVLRRFGRSQVAAMREQVIRMIPGIVYRDPRAPSGEFRDAFDVAVDGLIRRVSRIKQGLPPGEEEDDDGSRHWDGYFDTR
ncbi:xyloglucan galactosyltransferase KATAMARI1 homolog [Sorghum bicolor]|uniref:Exostosin GT47 domain-containing protein n=1 Tax=Sorghum bicolor TaxID=4558 RepID=C5YQA1_SORBI|nr:xyloglucan galactosyltransferase KATAMARI1 homolog [Sorghum bicolor]EES16204.1 hypothetical protein SORBI_3008G138100 [Sorghum bicolor]|eukprot:XP_002442366.1 xyloglucan galactosyltransferase KATAMARI1 homolog [Sorghum bicolor]